MLAAGAGTALTGGMNDAGFDLDQQLDVPVGAEQFDEVLEPGIMSQRVGCQGDGRLRRRRCRRACWPAMRGCWRVGNGRGLSSNRGRARIMDPV